MRNNYIFDYRLVLEEDPSFEKFVNVETIDDTKNIRYYTDPLEETNDNNEEDKDIINLVHDKEEQNTNGFGNAAYNDIHALRADENVVIKDVSLKPEYHNVPFVKYDTSIPLLPPPNRFLLQGSESWQGEYTFYRFNSSAKYDSCKFVSLIHKYRFSQKDNFIRLQKTVYRFDRKQNVTSEMKKYLIMYVYNTKTKQLYKITQMKNNKLKKKSHFHNRIHKVFNSIPMSGWSSGMPVLITSKFVNEILKAAKKDVPDLVVLRKEDAVTRKQVVRPASNIRITVSKDVLNIVDLQGLQSINLAAIILQHRVGKPVKWLTYTLIKNIWELMGNKDFQESSINGMQWSDRAAQTKKAAALRRKTILKLVPNLKKSNHMQTAIKTIIGKHCNKFIIKMFNSENIYTQFLQTWVHATSEGMISKNLYHFVSNIIINSDSPNKNLSIILYSISNILAMMAGKAYKHEIRTTNFDIDAYNLIIDSYIKTYKRLSIENTEFVNWQRWYDMYNMASQLGIRLRVNKLKTILEIHELHDRLSDIIRRDKITIKKYRNTIFNEFKVPDKKYDEFEFIQMRTAEDLVEEGTRMKHCVASYANKCADGDSIIFSMRKNGKGYVTIELSTIDYRVTQKYTIKDYTVTNDYILGIIDKWNSDCIELHKDDKQTYYGICKNIIACELKKAHEQSIQNLMKKGIISGDENTQNVLNNNYIEELPRASAF